MANTEKLIREKAEKMLEAADQMQEAKEALQEEKKPLLIEMMGNGLYHVICEGGGRVPDKLQGSFTSIAKVKQLVEDYTKGR